MIRVTMSTLQPHCSFFTIKSSLVSLSTLFKILFTLDEYPQLDLYVTVGGVIACQFNFS